MISQRTIHVASDHAGFVLKNAVKEWLQGEGYVVHDHGALVYEAEDDFPDFIAPAVRAVSESPQRAVALIFGGSGQGEAMLANRFPNVRATVYYGAAPEIIALSRAHNDANVLSFGARFVTSDEIQPLITQWLTEAPLVDEKYLRRNRKVEQITKKLS